MLSVYIDMGKNERQILRSSLLQPHDDYACNAWYTGLEVTINNKLQTK